MEERLTQEIGLLRQNYPDLEYLADGRWVRIPSFVIVEPGWTPSTLDVAFQIPTAYPGTPPYGFYVQAGIRYKGSSPNNYKEPAPTQPPFEGSWGIFSWQPESGQWRPAATVTAGSNLLDWVHGFQKRFREGL